MDDAVTGKHNLKHTYRLAHKYTQLYKWVEQLFYEMKGEYFMSNGAKFRLQQLQGYFERLIIVTLI